jgi:hypothetical protein
MKISEVDVQGHSYLIMQSDTDDLCHIYTQAERLLF